MYLDALLLYSDAQALTVTAVSTNIVDHGSDGNLGIGEPMAIVIVVDVALDGTTGDETYTATIQTDDNSSFSSATTVLPAFSLARGSAAGTKFVLPIPADTVMERYSRISYTLGGTTPTGTVTAYMIPLSMVQNNAVYADAITITG